MFIRVLGRVGFGIDPTAVTLVTERVTAMVLAHLASADGRAIAPEVLIEAVWDRPTRTSRNAVQVAMSKLRRTLGPQCVVADRGGYALRTNLMRVDRSEANQAEWSARELCHEGAYHQALPKIDRAIALFDDVPFAGLHSFATAVLREEAERTFGALIVLRARCLLAAGRAREAVDPLRKQAADDQFDESVTALLMEALARSGRTADAVALFHDFRRRLGDELGVQPSRLVVGIFDQVLTDSLPPTAAKVNSLGMLPASASPTFGRDSESAEITALVDQGYRLVTIVGAGGLGKSTVAIVAARDLTIGKGRPAVMVDLTLCTRSEDVMTMATKVLDPGAVGLEAALGGMFPVVILDNAEHVVAAVGDLASRLLLIAGVDVMVTSRRPLRLKEERLFELQPLVGDGEQSAALALLLDRAGLNFGQSPAGLRVLQQIAARADGIPLVLELLAAALRWRPPIDLLADLDSSDEPVGGDDRRPARHRTVAAVVDWSLSRLNPEIASALGALTVIRGRFDEQAAAAVIEPTVDLPINEVLAAILDLSLLQRIPLPGRISFRMLEPVRQGIRASSVGKIPDAVHTAHARYFLNHLRRVGAQAADHANAYRGLDEWDQGNVLPALSWLWDHDRVAAVRFLPSVIKFWTPSIIDDDTYFLWIDLAMQPGVASELDRGRVAIARFEAIVFFRNERPNEIAVIRAVIAQAHRKIDAQWRYRLNSAEGGWARARGDISTAIELLESTEPAGARDRVVRDARVAECHWYAGNHQKALAALDAAQDRLNRLQDHDLQRAVFSMRMFVALQESDLGSAEYHYARLERLVRTETDDDNTPYILSHVVWMDIEFGQFKQALIGADQMLAVQLWLSIPSNVLEIVMVVGIALLGIGADALASRAAVLARRLDSDHPGSLNPYARQQLHCLSPNGTASHDLWPSNLQDAIDLTRTLVRAGRNHLSRPQTGR